MRTHGHYQQIIARDAQPVADPDGQDTVVIAPGQRVDVVLKAHNDPLRGRHRRLRDRGTDGGARAPRLGGMLLRLALIAGGPTTLGTMIGYVFNSPELNVIFLTVAAGALVYVIGELWASSNVWAS